MEKLIYVIIGSTRPTRIGDVIAEWVAGQITPLLGKQDVKVEVLDLAKVNLPIFNEPEQPKTGIYKYEHTKRWSEQIARADGFIFVTPEYNHSYPAVIKNAIDYLFNEWAGKPMAFVGYGWGGGRRAVEHLRAVAGGVKAVALQAQVAISLKPDILDQNGKIETPEITLALYKTEVEAVARQLADAVKSVSPASR